MPVNLELGDYGQFRLRIQSKSLVNLGELLRNASARQKKTKKRPELRARQRIRLCCCDHCSDLLLDRRHDPVEAIKRQQREWSSLAELRESDRVVHPQCPAAQRHKFHFAFAGTAEGTYDFSVGKSG